MDIQYEIIPSLVNDGIPCCNTFIFWQRVTFWLSNLDKSNVGISNYMPIILWIIQKCHANISQICNIHNDVFFKVLLQKVKEGAVLSRVVSFYDVWIFLTWLSTFCHAHPDAIDCFWRNQLACKLFTKNIIKL